MQFLIKTVYYLLEQKGFNAIIKDHMQPILEASISCLLTFSDNNV